MSAKKITTIEELGDVLQDFRSETKTTFNSIGDHLTRVEDRLERVETRLMGLEARFDRIDLRDRVERIAQILREKLHVEV